MLEIDLNWENYVYLDYEQKLKCETFAEIEVWLHLIQCTLDDISNQHLVYWPSKLNTWTHTY